MAVQAGDAYQKKGAAKKAQQDAQSQSTQSGKAKRTRSAQPVSDTYRHKPVMHPPAEAAHYADPTYHYLKEIGHQPLLDAEEEVTLALRVQQGDQTAKEAMVVANLRLVIKVASRYSQRGLPFMDLVDEGNLGLMHAVDKYDPTKGFRFSTYAVWWIRQSIERSIMNQVRTIRLPVHVIKRLNRYIRLSNQMATETEGKAPSVQQLAQCTKKSVQEVKKVMDLRQDVMSIDVPVAQDTDKLLVDTVADDAQEDVLDLLHKQDIRKRLSVWLSLLDDVQREVVISRFGLEGEEVSTLDAIGKKMGYTREHVRQIQINALRMIRQMVFEDGLSQEEIRG